MSVPMAWKLFYEKKVRNDSERLSVERATLCDERRVLHPHLHGCWNRLLLIIVGWTCSSKAEAMVTGICS
jgi:hypothetical protein